MKGSLAGWVAGAVVGAAGMAAWTMMSRSTQKKMSRFAVESAQRVADKAEKMFK